MRKTFTPALIVLILAAGAGFLISQQREKEEKKVFETQAQVERERLAALRFSNTQEWDDEYVEVLAAGQEAVALYKPKLTIPAPPTEPAAIEAELQLLHQYKEERTPEKIWEISSELEVEDAVFNGQDLEVLLADKPETKKLISLAFDYFEPIEIAFKKEFDRVRPSIYDQTLSTTIKVPQHPSYPSYHAADSMLIALILGSLDIENRDAYQNDVVRISHNREIAGVHYPSDSIAGQKLGADFFELIQTEDWYAQQYEVAEQEWNEN